MSDSLQPHGLQLARLPCPSLSPRVCSNSCPLSWWYHLTISSSVFPFSSCPQSFPASSMHLFQWVGSSHQVAKVLELPLQHQYFQWIIRVDFFLSKELSRVFSSTSIQKYKFFNAQPSLWFNSHILKWPLENPLFWLGGPLSAKWCLWFSTHYLGLSQLFFQGANVF